MSDADRSADESADASADGSAAARVHDLLREQDATLATAESLTGGRLAAALTAVPGASATYVGGVVSYATDVKVEVLGVPRAVVEQHGVVSAECALAMARGVQRVLGASHAVATTGVAGPDTQEGKPVGTVYVAVVGAGSEEGSVAALELTGDRASIVDQTCGHALDALGALLERRPGS